MTYSLVRVLENYRPQISCVTMSKLLSLSEPQTGIIPASYVAVRPVTGNTLVYEYISGNLQTLKHQSSVSPKPLPLLFSSQHLLFLKCSPLLSPVGIGPNLQDRNQIPSLQEGGQPCNPSMYWPWPQNHSSAALMWHRIHSLILWLSVLYHSPPNPPPQKASFKEGLASVLLCFWSLTIRPCSW